jgi:hypothetical protein
VYEKYDFEYVCQKIYNPLDDAIQRLSLECAKEKDKMRVLVYHNLETWDWVREEIADKSWGFKNDERVMRTDSNIIRRMLEHFNTDTEAYFMINNAPNTEVPLLTGEIGQGTLYYPEKDKFFGVPRIKYKTKRGEVQLFPDEIHPMSLQEIQLYVNEGYKLSTDGRYIPSLQHLEMIYNAFGSRVGLRSDYKKVYHSIIDGDAQDPKNVMEQRISVYGGEEEEF